MEINFQKKDVGHMKLHAKATGTQECTQEIRLTEGMSDIGKVLGAWGQIMIRGKEWRTGSVSVSGGVMIWVLYEPEGGGEIQTISDWLPFQMLMDTPKSDRDGTICVQPILSNTDARMLSARKLMVRASICVIIETEISAQACVYTPEQLPDEVQLLRYENRAFIPSENGEKSFFVEEQFQLPAGMPDIGQILRYELHVEPVDRKIVSDKVVFRGALSAYLLYIGTDQQIYSTDFEMSFSQFSQLSQECDTEGKARLVYVITDAELRCEDSRNIYCKVCVLGQYAIYLPMELSFVTDAYSTKGQLSAQFETINMPLISDHTCETVHAELKAELKISKVLDVSFHITRCVVESDNNLLICGCFAVLYTDEYGQMLCEELPWECRYCFTEGKSANVSIAATETGKAVVEMNANTLELKASILIEIFYYQDNNEQMIAGINVLENEKKLSDRPSLIIRRKGEDSIWQIAKACASTVDRIREANDLSEDPVNDQMLIVPVG